MEKINLGTDIFKVYLVLIVLIITIIYFNIFNSYIFRADVFYISNFILFNKNKIKEITIENLVLILIKFFIKEVKMNQYFNNSFYEYL